MCSRRLQGEEAYQNFERVIENANVIMATYTDDLLGDCQVRPPRGWVLRLCFGSALLRRRLSLRDPGPSGPLARGRAPAPAAMPAGTTRASRPDRPRGPPCRQLSDPAVPLLPLFVRSAQVYPYKGTVSFSAGLHGWAFTLTVFATVRARRRSAAPPLPSLVPGLQHHLHAVCAVDRGEGGG